jgi:hypothetical protein
MDLALFIGLSWEHWKQNKKEETWRMETEHFEENGRRE